MVIAESYFIQTGTDNLFSIIALGVVLLITGYLFLDSIRSKLSESGKEIKNYIDQMYLEETGRWNERLTELQNLQKATYTATKKNTATISEQLEALNARVVSLEVNNAKNLKRRMDLQLKALEGQKKALSLEINHNKENTRQLMKAIVETGNQSEIIDLLNKIAERLEDNTRVLQQELQNMSTTVQKPSISNQHSESNWITNVEPRVENLTETGWDVDAEVELGAKISSWESDTASFPEEDITDWNSGVEQEETELSNDWNAAASSIDWTLATETEQLSEITDNSEASSNEAAMMETNWNSIDMELNKLIVSWEEEPGIEKTPDSISSEEDVIVPEAVETLDETEIVEPETQKQEIKPLYDDPNKALSADEIAALFASFGQ